MSGGLGRGFGGGGIHMLVDSAYADYSYPLAAAATATATAAAASSSSSSSAYVDTAVAPALPTPAPAPAAPVPVPTHAPAALPSMRGVFPHSAAGKPLALSDIGFKTVDQLVRLYDRVTSRPDIDRLKAAEIYAGTYWLLS